MPLKTGRKIQTNRCIDTQKCKTLFKKEKKSNETSTKARTPDAQVQDTNSGKMPGRFQKLSFNMIDDLKEHAKKLLNSIQDQEREVNYTEGRLAKWMRKSAI